MKGFAKGIEGSRTTLGGKHLETVLCSGLYRDDPDMERLGMLRIDENEWLAFYRTENGIAIDLKDSNQHLILGTSNFGDPIKKIVWYCIAHEITAVLGGEFMPDAFVPGAALRKKSHELVAAFVRHVRHLMAARE